MILLGQVLGQVSGMLSLHPAVMETHPMGNDVAAWDTEVPVLGKQHNINDHEHSKPTDEMIADAGYPAETHDMVTNDGYILRLHCTGSLMRQVGSTTPGPSLSAIRPGL